MLLEKLLGEINVIIIIRMFSRWKKKLNNERWKDLKGVKHIM